MKNKKKKAILILIPILVFVILGSVVIYISYKTGKNDANKISASVNSTNVDIKTCGNPITTYKGADGKKKKIYSCLENYIITKENNSKLFRAMQNFAITKDYIYFSTAFDLDDTVKGTSRTYVVRVDRKTGVKKQMHVNYAGHAQSFDAVTNGTYKITKGNKIIVDQLFMNGFSNDSSKEGTFRGVYYTTFGSGLRYQANSIAIKRKSITEGKITKKQLQFKKISSKDNKYKDKETGKFSNTLFYNALKSYGSNSNYMTNPELAVSPDGKTIAFAKTINGGFDGGNAEIYVYSMKDFKKLNGNKILYQYNIQYIGNKQGVEIDDKYLYIWSEYKGKKIEKKGEHFISLYKYNLKTGKQVGGTVLTEDYLTGLANRVTGIAKNQNKDFPNGKSYNSFEAEGMSVYDGKVYVGIVYRGDGLKSINNIYMIDGV